MTMAVANGLRRTRLKPPGSIDNDSLWGGTLVPAEGHDYGSGGLVGAPSHRHLALPGRCAPVRWTPVSSDHNQPTLQATLQRASLDLPR
jgi:hypothetical protein